MRKDTTVKLADVEATMRRWHSRLTRASNALGKLERQRRRLMAQTAVARVTAPPGQMTPNQVEAVANVVQAVDDQLGKLASPDAETDIPDWLRRGQAAQAAANKVIRDQAVKMQEKSDAQLVDTLKAKRAAQVAADKHKMPLTGKAAIDYLKVTPKRKRAK